MQVLITAIVAVILLVGVASSCPSDCDCTDTLDGVDVDCSSKRLSSIPTDLPNNTYKLDLYNNNISVIEDNSFNNLPKLRYLDLHQNKIKSIKSDTFNSLTNLYLLDLHENKITSIKSGTFNNLGTLYKLYLHKNKITSIKSDTFNNLGKLYQLDLDNNSISVIEDNNFNNLTRLKELNLHQNKITSIKSDTFSNLGKLYQLDLHNNKITSIKSDTFNNLGTLHQLDLDNNSISVIEDNNFNNLIKLRYLRMGNNPISFVGENTFENLSHLTSLVFDMHCRGCDNIPFLRWLKRNQSFTTSIMCNDFDGEKLSNLQSNQVCFGCSKGHFGNNCNDTCDGCISKLCNSSDGVCDIQGFCETGWYGVKCDKAATKSDDNYTVVYTGVGASIATALVAVIIVLVTLRYRRQKKQQKRSTTKEYDNTTFSDDYVNSGVHNTEPHYVAPIPVVEEGYYDTI